ncbi:Glycosyltransferase involved in cell wall bisynthesis [Dyadobacter koreensis]|uniref:Glycosyltransferase involved in cell wall bisynthesis n=1 Tax=Dyadobacter koreensis TaxID=408657 RepID=A0A1H6V962_9BACT|nr:glycosyltransferase [Dyadobacter koreensis]SEI99454.1 Glycosyltransferase involved in cell wall bisynthesis [Dyadobacter koreensis]
MKLNGYTIIIFGLPRFDQEIESTNFTTAKLLARNNKVFYVENPFTIKDYFKYRKHKQNEVRKGFYSPFNANIKDTGIPNLKIVIPPVLLSINFLPEGKLFRKLLLLNESLIRKKIKSVIRDNNIKDFIFINSFNFHYPNVVRGLKPIVKIYHCLDPLILPFDSRHGVVSEKILVKESDVVLCSAKQLYSEKVTQNPNTYFVPNAADLSHSRKALDPELPVFPSLTGISGPVIGYFGAIERRIDYDILQKVIVMNVDKTFVFVGPVSREFIPDVFFNLPNVKFTGSVPYEAMPSVIKRFDVALIPFKKDEVSATIFPLKLFEYLGAGKPVVATDFNLDLRDFTGESVLFCENAESFSTALNEALNNDDSGKKLERLAIAEQNTWEKRVDEMAEIIFNTITIK